MRDIEKKFDKSMGRVRRRLLEAMGDMRPADLARMTGVPPSTLSGYFRTRAIPAEFIVEACIALDISANWLLLGEGPRERGRVDLSGAEFEDLASEYTRRLKIMVDLVNQTKGACRGKED